MYISKKWVFTFFTWITDTADCRPDAVWSTSMASSLGALNLKWKRVGSSSSKSLTVPPSTGGLAARGGLPPKEGGTSSSLSLSPNKPRVPMRSSISWAEMSGVSTSSSSLEANSTVATFPTNSTQQTPMFSSLPDSSWQELVSSSSAERPMQREWGLHSPVWPLDVLHWTKLSNSGLTSSSSSKSSSSSSRSSTESWSSLARGSSEMGQFRKLQWPQCSSPPIWTPFSSTLKGAHLWL